MPTKYNITNKFDSYELHESNGICIAASPSIDWAVSLPFVYFQTYAQRKGWSITPQVEASNDTTFEFQRSTYVVSWHGNRMHITRDDEEISWQELPAQLKGLL